MLGLLRRVPEGSPARSANVLRFVGGSGTVQCQRNSLYHALLHPGASRTAADLVLARDNAARRSHRTATMSVVAIRRAGILVALGRFLQGASGSEGR